MKTAEELANEFYLLADEPIMENRVLLYEETIKLLNIWKSSICKQQRENCAEDARLMKNQYGQWVSSDSILNAKEPE